MKGVEWIGPILCGAVLASAMFDVGAISGHKAGYELGVRDGKLKGKSACLDARTDEIIRRADEAIQRMRESNEKAENVLRENDKVIKRWEATYGK